MSSLGQALDARSGRFEKGRDNMSDKYVLEGETYELDDSKGCYVEVTYKGQVGWIGVNLSGTKERPYTFSLNPSVVSEQGIASGVYGGATESSFLGNLSVLCRRLLAKHRETERQRDFNKEDACKSMHEEVKRITQRLPMPARDDEPGFSAEIIASDDWVRVQKLFDNIVDATNWAEEQITEDGDTVRVTHFRETDGVVCLDEIYQLRGWKWKKIEPDAE